jgi:TetR/AcrR family transcriptional regulator, regulator of cefoperazone and chloramphenicol sensitivity
VPRHPTKDRVIAAATALFAERGFHGTTMRDIAERAGVNVAAGNYHYGSKKALYLEVLRAQFAEIRTTLETRRVNRPESELRHLSRRELVALLRARIRTMLDILIGPPPSPNATLMQREMCDPTEALPVIVEEFIRPIMGEMGSIVAHVAPELEPDAVERCVRSVAGQALFYSFVTPAMLVILGLPAYPRGFARELASHITAFSLGGMERLANSGRRRHRAT